MTAARPRVAVLVPCYNEEAAVATVVADFRKALPAAEIFVYDNNSSDRTVEVARAAGAMVRSERRQGKGHVVRRMFADIDADIYVLVDGDATYDAPSAPRMIDQLVNDHLDMVVGFRVDQSVAAYRPGHRTGNRMLTRFLATVFGEAFKDILSGYRVFSRRFVKSFPVLSDGFEIETELTVHALELALPVDRDRDALLCAAGRLGQQAQYLARRFPDSRHHPETVPLGKAAAVLHRDRHLPDAGLDRPRGPRGHHLSRGRPGAAAADRGAVDGADDRGGAVGLVGPGAGHGDARPTRNEAFGLFVPAGTRRGLRQTGINAPGDGPRRRQMLSRAPS